MSQVMEDQDTMYRRIDHLIGQYSVSNYGETFRESERIGGFVYECQCELGNYVGCRKGRIKDYVIESILELLNQNKSTEVK